MTKLIVIDTKKKTYTRYINKKLSAEWYSDINLSAEEIEELRITEPEPLEPEVA